MQSPYKQTFTTVRLRLNRAPIHFAVFWNTCFCTWKNNQFDVWDNVSIFNRQNSAWIRKIFKIYLTHRSFWRVRVTPALVFSVVWRVLCLSFVSFCLSCSCLSSDLTIFVCPFGIFEIHFTKIYLTFLIKFTLWMAWFTKIFKKSI